MKIYLSFILSIAVILAFLSDSGCKKKKEPAMVDIESIDVDNSHNEKYIFRDELKKEQEKKAKSEKMNREKTE